MAELVLAVPGDIAAPTGGYRYDARVIAELTGRGQAARALSLPDNFPAPSDASIAGALKALSGVPAEATLVVDGLAYGALPAEGIVALGRPVAALVHHPLALETGLSPEDAARLEASERAALAAAALVIATSEATRTILVERFGLDGRRVRVAEPGVDPKPRAKGGGEVPVVLSVGAVTPRKNHATLARALATLSDLPWRWVVAGALDRAPPAPTP
ncbi:glycosyltransferase [Chenggangzhangella methanolivorans]|uniref:Glycosyltransferase n=1 Tax=Chenggangzhangella methanolivorans TaxID=1437009 RepID=A0A9E6R7C6_9HYPH|nr:glycosyltransferase [Chenggangzhangella methanolivorans]QZN98619.1 glycosyltransferase [Chenggangzhangella methanolivorans]